MATDLNFFEPLHMGHAIEQVTFVVQFEQGVDDTDLKLIHDAIEAEKDLPGKAEIRAMGFAFNLGLGPQVFPQGQTGMSGYVFSRTRADGIVEAELRVERNSILFRTILYEGWNKTWPISRKYLEKVIPHFASKSGILAIGMMYLDKFVWRGAIGDCRASHLFQQNSKYISSHVFDAPDLWHSHTGLFTRADGYTKRLLSINADCTDEQPVGDGPRRVVAINTVQTDFLNQQGYDRIELTKDNALTFVEQHIEALHVRAKDVLSGIISADMVKRIGL